MSEQSNHQHKLATRAIRGEALLNGAPLTAAAFSHGLGGVGNFIVTLAVVFGLAIRSGLVTGPLAYAVVIINLVLAVFNLIPIPPLDGSKLLYPVLPVPLLRTYLRLERFGIFIVVGLVYFFGGYILSPPVRALFRFITGAG